MIDMTIPSSFDINRFFGKLEDIDNLRINLSSYILCNLDNKDVENLANSIKQHVLLHLIIVNAKEDYYFEIVEGCRRYLACKSLKWKKIPCHVVHLSDVEKFEVALVENIQRESFTPLEKANAFKMYISKAGVVYLN
jgi:ParB family transcriptional regulator, chromosome partitioning protein